MYPYPLDLGIHDAGVPWVAVDAHRRQIYTAEWDMPHDRINVFDLQMHFKRFVPLVYPDSLGNGFRLSRIQGAKVWGHMLYATRDDAAKTVFSIDLRTGIVTKLFSLDPPTSDNELEGISMRPTDDGALPHLLIVVNNKAARRRPEHPRRVPPLRAGRAQALPGQDPAILNARADALEAREKTRPHPPSLREGGVELSYPRHLPLGMRLEPVLRGCPGEPPEDNRGMCQPRTSHELVARIGSQEREHPA